MQKRTCAGHVRDWMPLQAAIVASVVLSCATAEARTYVRAECRPIARTDQLDPSPVAARWYRRFWTGDCDGLKGCLNGSPNWNEIVGKLVAKSRPQDRQTVLVKACRLGPLIGQEWTRPRGVRHIDSGDLRGFKKTLESAGDVVEGVDRVEAQVRAKIGRGRG